MDDYGPATYGDRWAAVYDEWTEDVLFLETEASVGVLAELARGGPVLELGIGTGRVALPLAARGLEVHGIDASEAMVEKLRAKPGGRALPVTTGDFADVSVEGRFPLIFVVFTTFFALTTQEAQVRCFRNVADHLIEGGCFLIEAFVPDVTRFDRGQRLEAHRVELDRVELEAARHDPIAQRVDSQRIVISEAGIQVRPVSIRYAYPSELDLMARLAGLELRHRWSGWRRDHFATDSTRHVSVYKKP